MDICVSRCRADVVRVRRRRFGRGEKVVEWAGAQCWVVMRANIVCCSRAARRVCVSRGPEVPGGHRMWQERFGVFVGGNDGRVQGGRRGQMDCGGMKGDRMLDVARVRRRAVSA